jgi:hypothetical protein
VDPLRNVRGPAKAVASRRVDSCMARARSASELQLDGKYSRSAVAVRGGGAPAGRPGPPTGTAGRRPLPGHTHGSLAP